MSVKIEGEKIFKQEQLPEDTPRSVDAFFDIQGNSLNLKNGQIQSPNYVAGRTGWKINSEGEAEFQSITANISNIIKSYRFDESVNANEALYFIPAISFGAYSEGLVNATSNSFNHTVGTAGASRVLVAGVLIQNDGDAITSITYNGVSLTQATKLAVGSDYLYIYYLINPTTGTNTLSATRTGSGANAFNIWVASYYSAQQYNQMSVRNTTNSLSNSINVPKTGDWIVSVGRSTAAIITSGTNNTVRGTASSNRLGDSNGSVTAGVQSVTFGGGGGTQGMISVVLSASATDSGTVGKSSALSANTSNSFAGFALSAVQQGEDGKVIISGEVNNFVGVTAGSLYYLSDTFGAISSSVGTVTRKVGIGVSPTSILITNIW